MYDQVNEGGVGGSIEFEAEHCAAPLPLAEVRCPEIIKSGQPSTPFMSFGDRIEIEMLDENGASIFGKIDQRIVQYYPPS